MAITSYPDVDQRPLRGIFPPADVRSSLLAREAWTPVPAIDDRAAWDDLPAERRADLVRSGEALLGAAWPEIPCTASLAFQRTGDRRIYETPQHTRRYMLRDLVLAECAENQGRFLDDIINGVWAICEESFWGVSAHIGNRRFGNHLVDTADPTVDLFAAESAGQLAWTDELLGVRFDPEVPMVRDRLRREVHSRVVQPFLERDDWWWLGLDENHHHRLNNWTPWIQSNILAATLLLDEDPARRERVVQRVIGALDVFLASYDDDGACDEGISYWGHAGGSLFECLELLRSATGSRLDGFGLPLVQEIGRYHYRMHIGEGWYVNFADGSARPNPQGALIAAYGHRVGDATLRDYGLWVASRPRGSDEVSGSLRRRLLELFPIAPAPTGAERPPLPASSWLPDTEVMTARETGGSTAGLFVAAKGGHNGESHNHNDVGQFVVAVDGNPVVIDPGVATYTRQTFSADRYDLWTMQSSYHNLPEIDGTQQGVGPTYRARSATVVDDGHRVRYQADLAPAYPETVGISEWHRTVELDRGTTIITMTDRWAINDRPRSIILNLMVSGAVTPGEDGQLTFTGKEGGRGLTVSYPAGAWDLAVERVDTDDQRLRPVWGTHIYRVRLTHRQPDATGEVTVTMRATD